MGYEASREIARLRKMSPQELRGRYEEVFGEPTRSANRDYLVRRIGWRIQVLEEGGLSERAQRRAEELASDADLRVMPPRERHASEAGTVVRGQTSSLASGDGRLPIPGSVLVRDYKGQEVRVTVLQRPLPFRWSRLGDANQSG